MTVRVTVRVYVPSTSAGLRVLVADGVLPADEVAPAGPITAPGEDEEAEYAALMTAADASAALVAERGEPGRRRVVVVAEPADPGRPPTLAEVVSVHLDVEDRDEGADPDDDLAWFAPEELAHLR